MKTFKTFLLEYLTDGQRVQYKYIEMTRKARSDTDHFFGEGNDKVTGNLNHMTDKSEIHRKVERHLGKEISHSDYRTGVVKDRYGRDTKIGRSIKDEHLRSEYARDPTREGAKTGSQYTTSTVRGIEVAGQTNSVPDANHPSGHSWKNLSCKNVENGIKRDKLTDEIEHGTVVHFVHDHSGKEIYRATLQPHHNNQGHVAYDIDSEYGIKHPSFTKSARDVAEKLSGPRQGDDVYEKHPDVYNDSGATHMIHRSASANDLNTHMKSNNFAVRMAVLRHQNATTEHIDAAINDQNRNVRREATKSPLLRPEHINKILGATKENARVLESAVSNPNANHENLMKALDSNHGGAREKALEHANATTEHITKALKPNQPLYIRAIALAHKKVTPSHINDILNTKSEDYDTFELHKQAASHPKANSENLHKALDHEDPAVRALAINNKNAKPEHIERGLNDPHISVRQAAEAKRAIKQ